MTISTFSIAKARPFAYTYTYYQIPMKTSFSYIFIFILKQFKQDFKIDQIYYIFYIIYIPTTEVCNYSITHILQY